MLVALCVLGAFAVATTMMMMMMMFVFVHSDNISRAEEARERKEKMNNLKTNLEKNGE